MSARVFGGAGLMLEGSQAAGREAEHVHMCSNQPVRTPHTARPAAPRVWAEPWGHGRVHLMDKATCKQQVGCSTRRMRRPAKRAHRVLCVPKTGACRDKRAGALCWCIGAVRSPDGWDMMGLCSSTCLAPEWRWWSLRPRGQQG